MPDAPATDFRPVILGGDITAGTATLVALLLISGTQFTLFAMWFDMESNKDLR